MKCPLCNGILRVMVGFANIHTAHYPILCGKCFAYFEPELGEPFGRDKLPPEFPLFRWGREMNEEEIRKRGEEDIEEIKVAFPTIEDFKSSPVDEGLENLMKLGGYSLFCPKVIGGPYFIEGD